MDDLLKVANWLLPLFYLALLIDYGATFFMAVRVQARSPWVVAVIAVHAAFLVLRGTHAHDGYSPLVGQYGILSVIAVSMAAMYWVLERIARDRRAGLFIFGLIFLFQYTASVFLPTAAPEVAGPWWARLHILPAALAYTALSLGGVYGLLHLVAQHNLKKHRFGLLFDRLPPLELLGKMTWWALLHGFGFMTVSIATGMWLAHSGVPLEGQGPKLAAKIAIGSFAWVICLVAILGRTAGKWPMSRISLIAVAGFLTIMALLVASATLSS
jgi:ABC-type uncharacterized transport system permease subunit